MIVPLFFFRWCTYWCGWLNRVTTGFIVTQRGKSSLKSVHLAFVGFFRCLLNPYWPCAIPSCGHVGPMPGLCWRFVAFVESQLIPCQAIFPLCWLYAAFVSSSRKQIRKNLPIPRTQKVHISGPNMSSISSMSSTFQTLVEPHVRSSCRFVVPLLRVCCFLLAFDLLAPSTSMSAMLGLHILESSCKGLVQAWVPACSYARRA